jgi:surface polysaccharide O-acyltransferase-like enzyme
MPHATPSEVHPPRRLGRSLLALLAGMLVGIILSIGTDVVLHVIGLFPALGQPISSPPLLLATVYRSVYGVIGSYIAARLAPDQPMTHALALGIIGFLVSIVGAVVTWNKGPAFGPHWYPVALIVLAIPTAWLGGKLRMMQLESR